MPSMAPYLTTIHPPSPFLPSLPKTIYQSQILIHLYIFSQHSKDVGIGLCILTFTLYHPYLVCDIFLACYPLQLFSFLFSCSRIIGPHSTKYHNLAWFLLATHCPTHIWLVTWQLVSIKLFYQLEWIFKASQNDMYVLSYGTHE